jgi:hypothetical protein
MDNKKTYHPVNWIDGMKVNKDHFISTDNHLAALGRNICSTFLNPFNYGLLLQTEESSNPVNIRMDIDNQGFVHVRVVSCHAVTRGGSAIEISDENYSGSELSAAVPDLLVHRGSSSGRELFLCLTVNLFERVPFGMPNPDELPPRLPHVVPGYHLSVHPPEEKESIAGPDSLIIGRILFADDKPEIDDSYIPACHAIYSHPKLAEYHTQILRILGQIEIDVVDILRSIKTKKQVTTIAETVTDLSDATLNFLGVHMAEFRKIAMNFPPVYIFEQMAALARTINNAINKQPAAEREELYNYIQDWSNLKQGEFEKLLSNAIEFSYDHDDINSSIQKLAPFINNMSQIFHTLSNLDFIGKKKDRQIFVKEQKEKPGNSFLVD